MWSTNTLEQSLAALEPRTGSAREIALLRIECLNCRHGEGLAAIFVPIFNMGMDSWLEALEAGNKDGSIAEEKKVEHSSCSLFVADSPATKILRRILQIHIHLSSLDATLAEELGLQGSHVILARLINYDCSCCPMEGDRDAIMELQDLACEVAACTDAFPIKRFHLSVDVLRKRLPLAFQIQPIGQQLNADYECCTPTNSTTQMVLIHQVTARQSAQEDVGFVMWPSAVALSTWLVSNPDAIQNRCVLELGAGCGLSGLVAAGLQRSQPNRSVFLTDFNVKVIENLKRNILLNNVHADAKKLDFYDQSGTNEGWLDGQGQLQRQVDVIIAADMICQPEDAVAAANTIQDALKPGGKAYIILADAAHRFGVDRFEGECHRVGLHVAISNVADLCNGKILDQNLCLTTGYVDGMILTMFFINKPA